MQVSSGLPHKHTSNHRGRGNEPVVVLGKIKSFVAVSMHSLHHIGSFLRATEDRASRDAISCCKPFTDTTGAWKVPFRFYRNAARVISLSTASIEELLG